MIRLLVNHFVPPGRISPRVSEVGDWGGNVLNTLLCLIFVDGYI